MDSITVSPAPFELLYASHGPRILAYAFSWLRDRHAAEDVLQEVFARLHQEMTRGAGGWRLAAGGAAQETPGPQPHAPRAKPPAAEKVSDTFFPERRKVSETGAAEFLFGVARSRIIDLLRRRSVRAGAVRLEDAPEPEQVGPTRTDGPAEQAEVHRLINRALLALPAEQCEVVLLRVFAQFTFEQIARVTRAPLPTVASRYRYALAGMAPMLKELWVEA
jgi:RNA polymerase sigma-70 factor (ECF subfamily)